VIGGIVEGTARPFLRAVALNALLAFAVWLPIGLPVLLLDSTSRLAGWLLAIRIIIAPLVGVGLFTVARGLARNLGGEPWPLAIAAYWAGSLSAALAASVLFFEWSYPASVALVVPSLFLGLVTQSTSGPVFLDTGWTLAMPFAALIVFAGAFWPRIAVAVARPAKPSQVRAGDEGFVGEPIPEPEPSWFRATLWILLALIALAAFAADAPTVALWIGLAFTIVAIYEVGLAARQWRRSNSPPG